MLELSQYRRINIPCGTYKCRRFTATVRKNVNPRLYNCRYIIAIMNKLPSINKFQAFYKEIFTKSLLLFFFLFLINRIYMNIYLVDVLTLHARFSIPRDLLMTSNLHYLRQLCRPVNSAKWMNNDYYIYGLNVLT